jgi:alpha-tubulin suppressor-like RCC1 family protein
MRARSSAVLLACIAAALALGAAAHSAAHRPAPSFVAAKDQAISGNHAVAIGDLNGDGDPATPTLQRSTVSVLLNRGGSGAAAVSSHGSGAVTGSSPPGFVSPAGTTATAIGAGYGHTCALTSAQGVKCWGFNTFGQIGDGTTTNRPTPVDVAGLARGVAAIAVGGHHVCALTTAGAVKCWGENDWGELGDGTSTNRLTPIDVSGLGSGVAAIAGGGDYTCALTAGGGVKCWGANGSGQLGDGTSTNRLAPVDVSGLASGVAAITAGTFNTCALMSTGGVKCWGDNGYGDLGDGQHCGRYSCWTPVDVSGLSSGMVAVAAGGGNACALTSARSAKCWGQNDYGEIGDGTTTNRLTPVDVAGLASGLKALAGGVFHTCALTGGGGVNCWGLNGSGQLGDGTTTSRPSPAAVSGLASGVAAVAAGSSYSCALRSTGGVKCWGGNNAGQLGDGTRTNRRTPVEVVGFALPKPKCVVPKVIGTRLAKAKRRIAKAHCRTGKVTSKPSGRKLRGWVLAQSPAPGKKLKNGAKVNLTVGKGPKRSR